jgi:monoamine oxidase
LAAADVLVRSGAEVRLFDARSRIGGRVRTLPDALAPGLPAELGGEFINSDHKAVLALARRLQLPLLDTLGPGEESFRPVYAMAHQPYPLEHAARDLGAFFQEHQRDLKVAASAVGAGLNTQVDPALRELDSMSIADYLRVRGCPRPLWDLLETAYTTEFGADVGLQSALNLLIMFAGQDPESWQTGHSDEDNPDVLGSSDERFKLVLGSESLAAGLQAAVVAKQPGAAPRLEHLLTAIRTHQGTGDGALELVFDQSGGGAVTYRCDRVILALPFLQLRKVDLRGINLEDGKKRVIEELSHGRSSKVIVGTAGRPWRNAGHNGSTYYRQPYPVLTWDTSRGRPGENGGLTFFLGGSGTALTAGSSSESSLAELRPGLEAALPELRQLTMGRILRAHWPGEPHLELGYTAYSPGQWTRLSGWEARPALGGRLLFAGEHTSLEYQGYMEGAVESGIRAAQEALRRVGAKENKA